MDHPDNFKLTPPPVPKHHHRVLLYGLIALLLVFMGVGLGYVIGRNSVPVNYQQTLPPNAVSSITWPTPTPPTNIKFNEYNVKNNCPLYGRIEDKNEYLTKYIVKSGDSLLSVANSQLKDNSRVGDIVYLNRDMYPQLSVDKPFLEKGWILYLPPPEIPRITTTGPDNIPQLPYSYAGELAGITNDGQWEIQTPEKSAYKNDKNFAYLIKIDTNTKFFGKTKEEFKPGDCIKTVLEGYSGRLFGVHLLTQTSAAEK
jgi:hypothetical protein